MNRHVRRRSLSEAWWHERIQFRRDEVIRKPDIAAQVAGPGVDDEGLGRECGQRGIRGDAGRSYERGHGDRSRVRLVFDKQPAGSDGAGSADMGDHRHFRVEGSVVQCWEGASGWIALAIGAGDLFRKDSTYCPRLALIGLPDPAVARPISFRQGRARDGRV